MTIPCIVIAGTHSGCGKTTVASGIMEALTARGMKVQPFKVGPDFIDPTHHSRICGRPSRNLDPFMMGEEGCRETFERASAGADIAIVEGVMGLYDGVDGSDLSSTAQVARILKSPVLLVVDAKGMSRSIHALIDGFRQFDPTLFFAGVLLNRVGSPRHRQMIESSLSTPCFGWIPKREDLVVASRHLGLALAHESSTLAESGTIIEEFCDVDGIVSAASAAKPWTGSRPQERKRPACASIGIAFDEAFCFYYQDNFDRLLRAGAELVFFSPLHDDLPEVDAVYLGGGYPELYLPRLESSKCTRDLKQAAENGMPVYAECGGLMYLSTEIRDDKTYRMCGVLPARAEMTKRVQALGYVKGCSSGNVSFLPGSLEITGHEFHYSRLEPERDAQYAIRLSRGTGIVAGKDGLFSHNTLGCYTHSYFTPEFAETFVKTARVVLKK